MTVDYELPGDGSGSIQTHMVQPTEKLLGYLAQMDIRATFFVEVAELLVFEDAVRSGRCSASLAWDYDAILSQIRTMLLQGHDVQLHLHPQWFDACWNGEQWQMRSCHRGMLRRGIEPFASFVHRGKEWLEDIANDANVEYACRVFRAGGLHFDRTTKVADALLDAGFQMDTSTSAVAVCSVGWRHSY